MLWFEITSDHFPSFVLDFLIEFQLPVMIDQPLVSRPWSFRLKDFAALLRGQSLLVCLLVAHRIAF
jgi:hypothetical protein